MASEKESLTENNSERHLRQNTTKRDPNKHKTTHLHRRTVRAPCERRDFLAISLPSTNLPHIENAGSYRVGWRREGGRRDGRGLDEDNRGTSLKAFEDLAERTRSKWGEGFGPIDAFARREPFVVNYREGSSLETGRHHSGFFCYLRKVEIIMIFFCGSGVFGFAKGGRLFR